MNFEELNISVEKRHYYSASEGPFHSANNIYMFFGGAERGEIVDSVLREIRRESQLITVGGEKGSGKTLLALVLADRLKYQFNAIHYELKTMSVDMLLRHLLIEICPRQIASLSTNGSDAEYAEASVEQALKQLHAALAKPSPGNKPYVLLVDSEATIDDDSKRLLDCLSQFQKNGRPAIRIVLFRRVAVAADMAVAQTASILPPHHYWLRRLTLSEINEYLNHHMTLYDFNQRDTFTQDMASFVADRSKGVFSAINGLAKTAFHLASLEESDRVSMSHLMSAALPEVSEAQPLSFFNRHRQGAMITGSCLLILLAAAVTFS